MNPVEEEGIQDSYDNMLSTSLIILEPINNHNDYEPPLLVEPYEDIPNPLILNDNQSLRSSSEKSFSHYYTSLPVTNPILE